MVSKPSLPDSPKPVAAAEPAAIGEDARRANPIGAPESPATAPDDADEDDDEDDLLELDDDEDDEDLVVFTAREAAGALATIYGFVRPLLSNYKKIMALVGLGVVVETLFNVIMPLSLKFLIDDALGEEDFEALYKILGVLAAAGIFTSIVAVWYELWDARLAAALISDVRTRIFEHVQNLPAAYFARTKRGEILSRFSIDLSAFEGAVKSFANSLALPLLELIAGIFLMLFLNWQLAAVALLVFPITLIGPRILTPKAVQANYEQKLNESALLGVVQENVAAQAVIKAFTLQRQGVRLVHAAQRRGAPQDRLRDVPLDHGRAHRDDFGAVAPPRGARDRRLSRHQGPDHHRHLRDLRERVLGGLLQHRPCHAFHPGVDLSRPRRSGTSRSCWTSRRAARTGRALPTCRASPTTSPSTGSPSSMRAARTPVLDSLSLKLDAGKRIAIVGPSGSGKSTLLNLILRLYVPDEGRVTIDGVDIRKVTRESLRRSMAVVFQENMLFNMSIRENIRLGKEGATDEEVVEAARKAEIHRYIMSLPQKYDTPVGERGDTLSGGQRQRIAIARAIIRNPSVLLLDEATSALDQTTEAAINRTLLKVAKGRTMIWSTHRLTSVVEMDEIIVISGGKAIERGSHAELLAKNGVYRKLWDDQGHKPQTRPIRPTMTATMTTTRTRRMTMKRMTTRSEGGGARRDAAGRQAGATGRGRARR